MKNTLRRLINKVVYNNGRRSFKGSVGGVNYNVASLNDFIFAKKRISQGLGYNDEWLKKVHDKTGIDNLMDLGCNVGWFTLRLRYILGSDFDPYGFCVDANKDVVKLCLNNIISAGLGNIDCFTGLIGNINNACGDFYVNDSTEASSIFTIGPKSFTNPVIKVPRISIGALAGPIVYDLVKVDIEGAEIGFIEKEYEFIKNQVQHIIIEWHKPLSTPEIITEMMPETMKLDFVEGMFTDCGNAYFSRIEPLTTPLISK